MSCLLTGKGVLNENEMPVFELKMGLQLSLVWRPLLKLGSALKEIVRDC